MLEVYINPIILHIIVLVYCITNIKLGYNIAYIIAIIIAVIPILNLFVFPVWFFIIPLGEQKDTKLNRWLFRAYWENHDQQLKQKSVWQQKKN